MRLQTVTDDPLNTDLIIHPLIIFVEVLHEKLSNKIQHIYF